MRLSVPLLALGASLLTPLAAAKDYKGAEIYSKESYLYGRYEMRMQVAKGSGVLSTFFTYKNGSEVENTFWEEIDIEVFGKNNATQWQTNIITGTSRPTEHSEQVHTLPVSLGDAYHTYVLEWTPGYVAWYVDGVEARRINGTSTVTSLTSPQSLRFNIWASESPEWVGPWDDSILPVYQFVNYIEYKPYDPATKTFSGGWRDDFNTFDSTRWSKANWSFGGNRVDFSPENVVVKDGILVLALTTNAAVGYTGTPPADNASSASSTSSVAASSSLNSSAAASSAANSSAASSIVSSAVISSVAVSSTGVTSSTPVKKSGGGGGFHWLSLAMLGALCWYRRKVS